MTFHVLSLRHVIVALLVGVVVLWAGVAAALTPIGKVTSQRGVVYGSLTDGKSKSALKQDDAVFQNQVITTGTDGFAELLFADDSVLSIGRNSEVTLDTFVYDPQKNTGRTVITLTRGVFRFLSGAVGKNSADTVTYKTPVGTIGIRGSGAVVQVGADGATRVVLTQCCVTVQNRSGRVTLDSPLTFTDIASARSAPTPPAQLDAAARAEILDGFGVAEPQPDSAPTAPPSDAASPTQPTEQETRVRDMLNLLGTRPVGDGGRQQAQDGQRGMGGSGGAIGIQVRIVENLQADWLRGGSSSLNMTSESFSGDETVCVYHTGAGFYRISVIGSGPGGAFAFKDDKGNSIPYTVTWESLNERVDIKPGRISRPLSRGTEFGTDCTADSRNARLRITIPPQFLEAFKRGNFSGQTTILLETE